MKTYRGGNLRPAPAFMTPALVRRVLDVINKPHVVTPCPVVLVPVAGVKPSLRVVEPEKSQNDTNDTFHPTAEPAKNATKDTKRTAVKRAAKPTMADKAARFEQQRADRETKAAAKKAARPEEQRASRAAERQAYFAAANAERLRARQEADASRLEALGIAYDRGIAIADAAVAIGLSTGPLHRLARAQGWQFGSRSRLVAPINLAELLALADPQVPLPPTVASAREIEVAMRAEGAARRRELAQSIAKTAPASVAAAPPSAPAKKTPSPAATRTGGADSSANKAAIQFQRSRRTQIAKVRAAIASGETANDRAGKSGFMVFRAVEGMLADEARRACPIEAAKTKLQRKGRVVYSMAVYGGPADLFFVSGLGKDVTLEQLLAEAERIAA